MVDFNFNDVGINLPTLKEIDEVNYEDLTSVAKFRHHESGWEWYVLAGEEYNEDMILFCYVRGDYNELGSVMLSSILGVGAMFCPSAPAVKVMDLD